MSRSFLEFDACSGCNHWTKGASNMKMGLIRIIFRGQVWETHKENTSHAPHKHLSVLCTIDHCMPFVIIRKSICMAQRISVM